MPVKGATEQEEMVFPFEQKEVEISGKKFIFRELSVQENDDAADSSREEGGRINGRTMMRLMIIASSVEPKLTPKMLASLPQRVYAKIYDVVNELSDPDSLNKKQGDVEVGDDEGND